MGTKPLLKHRWAALFTGLLLLGLLAPSLPGHGTSGDQGSPGEQPAQVVYLVRHAEKAGPRGDVSLNDAGRERAQDLADLLADGGIRSILTTDFIRTRRTAAPLARELGLDPLLYDADDLEGAAARIRDLPGPVLVVGHSDTTPALAAALGGDPGPPIPDDEYDRLYRLEILPDRVRTRVLRFGTRTHPDPVDLRILTYNIHHGEGTDGLLDLERLAGVIGEARPDGVALQEVDAGTERAGGIDQAAAIAGHLGWEHAFAEAMPYQGGSYGEALLRLGVAAGVDIWSAEHRRIAAVVRAAGGVYKPSGAGGAVVGVKGAIWVTGPSASTG